MLARKNALHMMEGDVYTIPSKNIKNDLKYI